MNSQICLVLLLPIDNKQVHLETTTNCILDCLPVCLSPCEAFIFQAFQFHPFKIVLNCKFKIHDTGCFAVPDLQLAFAILSFHGSPLDGVLVSIYLLKFERFQNSQKTVTGSPTCGNLTKLKPCFS